jgi:histidinol dehydrogenase
MGAGDEKAQEKLKKEVEELKRKVAATELEKKQLQDQMLILTMQQMMKAKSSDTAPPPVEFWTKVVELMIKVIGAIGSVFSGLMFVVSWLRKRGGLPGGTAG